MLKEKVLTELLNQLSPLKTLYQKEIELIIKDLKNDELKSLETFLDVHYQDVFYSEGFQQFIQEIVKEHIVSPIYLEKMKKKVSYKILPFTAKDCNLLGAKPLKVKLISLKDFKSYQVVEEIKENSDKKQATLENEKILRSTILKEQIVKSRTIYLKDANAFIANLENMNIREIYDTFINFHDIGIVQHCISNLSTPTLNSLLQLIENKLKENRHNPMNIFLEEAIKRNLHMKNRLKNAS